MEQQHSDNASNPKTEVIVLGPENLSKIIQDAIRSSNSGPKNQNILESCDWITQEEAKKILPYKSKTTWRDLRLSGKLIFSQTGRIILYSRKSILNLIERNRK